MRLCLDPACTDGPTLDDGTPGPRRVADDLPGLLCRRCLGHLERRLAELVAQRDALRSVLGGTQGGSGGGTSRPKPGSRPPLNIAAHDHLEHVHALVVSWVRLVCEERDLHGPTRNDLAALAPWLLGQLDWISAQGWVGDFCEEVRDAARVAESLTRTQPAWHRLEAPCPDCGAQELGRWDGDDHVGCASCDKRWPEAHYGILVGRLLEDDGLTLTARQAAERIGVPSGTFRRWAAGEPATDTRPARPPRIKAVGKVDGLHRYATADVERLAEQQEECA